MTQKVCIVAILKDEEPFLDEWLVYHRLLGIDHFFLYDDDPLFPLRVFMEPHRDYVTVIDWHGMDDMSLEGRNNQTKAYMHAVDHHIKAYEWVLFIDGDEFVVLKIHETIPAFLRGFEKYSAVSLTWHLFGHNGYYDNPQGLITASLTRRMESPGRMYKTFTRSQSITGIDSAHHCVLKPQSYWVDANGLPFAHRQYPGMTDVAQINHYHCRSFKNWMGRVDRGDANFKTENSPEEHRWRLTTEACLRNFVVTVAKNHNEYVDEHMLRYEYMLEESLATLPSRDELVTPQLQNTSF